MYVICPSCQHIFRIHAEHLEAALGRARCGSCQGVFDARSSLQNSLAQAKHAVRRLQSQAAIKQPELASIAGDVNREVGFALAPVPIEIPKMPATSGVDADVYAQPVRWTPDPRKASTQLTDFIALDLDEANHQTINISPRTWVGMVTALLLIVLFSGQYLWKERNKLAQHQQFRPWLETYCSVLGCSLPLRRDLKKIAIVDRTVRNHPNLKNTLLVSATFINKATFPQSFPVFEISFSNTAGGVVLAQRFGPNEYLPGKASLATGLLPGEEAQLLLEIRDPGKQAVSYQFEFL